MRLAHTVSMRLQIVPSPSDDVVLTPYQERDLPAFRSLFENAPTGSPLRHFAKDPEEASTAVVFENQSRKDITALRYRWVIVDAEGKSRTNTVTSDSYTVDVYRPVSASGARQMLTLSGSVDEALINHVAAGGGFAGSGSRGDFPADAEEIWLQIDLIVFEDGEIAGSDPDHFAAELQGRKRAAEYVATHIRLAKAENRNATPVLVALRDIPHLGSDHLARLVSKYAQTYLQRSALTMGSVDMSEATLKHLESRPTLPKFYRRKDAGA